MKIVLATTSPYRVQAMKMAGIDFEAKSSNVEEKFEGRPNSPEELVKELSKLKAEAVAKDCVDSLVFGFDSVAYTNYEKKILEKPKDYEEAFARLEKLSGKGHDFYTGITAINTRTGSIRSEVNRTHVNFRNISDDEIKAYLEEDERYVTFALGYDPMGHRSASFVKNIDGDPNNVFYGIPLSRVVELIKDETKVK